MIRFKQKNLNYPSPNKTINYLWQQTSSGPPDADATAFLTATGITDSTISGAINVLVTDLKGYGIWTKMKALYPFVGGTASTHKYNLKDPQDTNAAFRLSFVGGWTHSATGALPNGVNAYADTFLIPSLSLLLNSTSFGFYSRTEADGAYYDMGVYDGTNNLYTLLRIGNEFYATINDNTNNQSLNTSSLGFFISSRIASNDKRGYRNGIVLQSATTASTGLNSSSVYLGKINGFSGFSLREHAFTFIGEGLSGTEAANYYTAVQSFQTTLGRQV